MAIVGTLLPVDAHFPYYKTGVSGINPPLLNSHNTYEHTGMPMRNKKKKQYYKKQMRKSRKKRQEEENIQL